MLQRLISALILTPFAISTVSAAELPVRRIDALRALIASEQSAVKDADAFLKNPVTPPQVDDVVQPADTAAVSTAIKRGWLVLGTTKFHPNEALSADDAIRWRLRASGLGAAVATTVDRESLPSSMFNDAVWLLRQYRWTLSPAYQPGDYLSLPDARALFATATGVILPANIVEYPHADEQLITSPLPSVVPDVSPTSWWPFPTLHVAVIDGIEQALGIVAPSTPQPSVRPQPNLVASVVQGVSQTLGNPWQVPVAPADPATQANDTVLKPTPDGDALPSVYGTGLEKYVSKKTFSITMPSIDISDLGVAHPTDPTNTTSLLAPLQYGVGHLFSYPGEGSTILIYGHSSNYPWDVSGFAKIFRQINRLKAGDKVYVTYGGKFIVYQVTGSQTIPADDLAAVSSGGEGEELVLYTCWPPDHIKQRYLVRAVPIAQYSI